MTHHRLHRHGIPPLECLAAGSREKRGTTMNEIGTEVAKAKAMGHPRHDPRSLSPRQQHAETVEAARRRRLELARQSPLPTQTESTMAARRGGNFGGRIVL
jgi:hypothetical protein